MQTAEPFLFMSCIVGTVGTGWACGGRGPHVFGIDSVQFNCVAIPLLAHLFDCLSLTSSAKLFCSLYSLHKLTVLCAWIKQTYAVAKLHITGAQHVDSEGTSGIYSRGFRQ